MRLAVARKKALVLCPARHQAFHPSSLRRCVHSSFPRRLQCFQWPTCSFPVFWVSRCCLQLTRRSKNKCLAAVGAMTFCLPPQCCRCIRISTAQSGVDTHMRNARPTDPERDRSARHRSTSARSNFRTTACRLAGSASSAASGAKPGAEEERRMGLWTKPRLPDPRNHLSKRVLEPVSDVNIE
jgi:hypothetical protein